MHPHLTTAQEELLKRLRGIANPALLKVYADAVEHTGTTDLIVYLDVLAGNVNLFHREEYREELSKHVDAQDSIVLKKTRRSAAEALYWLKVSRAFWLIVNFSDDEVMIVAVGEQPLADGTLAIAELEAVDEPQT